MRNKKLFKAKNDLSGNPRVVIRYVDFLSDKEFYELNTDQSYSLAYKRAKELNGKVYKGKDFDKGFVFQSNDDHALIRSINKIIRKNAPRKYYANCYHSDGKALLDNAICGTNRRLLENKIIDLATDLFNKDKKIIRWYVYADSYNYNNGLIYSK